MKRIGDDDAGFSVGFNPATGAVQVRGWGFWSAPVAHAFAETVREVCSVAPRGAPLLIDMAELKPLREEGQRSFGDLVGSLADLGVRRTLVTTASHLTKLQLLRLVAERGAKELVEFIATSEGMTRGIPAEETKRRLSR